MTVIMTSGGVNAVDRALTVLQAFRQGDGVVSLAEIARRTGFHKSTILRLLASLENFQIVVRMQSGGYRVGPELRRLGRLNSDGFDMEAVIRPALADLVAVTGETASFYVRQQSARLCLFRLNSPRAIRHHLEEGARLPLERGAAGRVLYAFTNSGRDADSVRIRQCREYVSYGERDKDIAAMAVPQFDESGGFRGALSVSGLISRFNEEGVRRALKALHRIAEQLSQRIPS